MKRLFLILILMGVLLPLGAQQYRLDPEATAAIRARMDDIHRDRPTVALVLSGGGAKGRPISVCCTTWNPSACRSTWWSAPASAA